MEKEKKQTLQESRDKLQNLVNILDEILSGNLSQSQAAQKLEMSVQKWDYTKKRDFLPFLHGLTPLPECEVKELLDQLHSPYENLIYDIVGYSGVFREDGVLVLTVKDEEKIQRSMSRLLSEQQQNVLIDLYGLQGEGKKTLGETADRLGISKTTVRTSHINGLRALRDPDFLKQFFQGYSFYIQRMEELSTLKKLNDDFKEELEKMEGKWKVIEPLEERLEKPLAEYEAFISSTALDIFYEHDLITVKDLMGMNRKIWQDCIDRIPELPQIFRELQLPLSSEDFGDSPLLDEDIAFLNLSVRSYHGLYRAGVKTIGDLISHQPEEIATLRNIGQKSIDEIYEKMEALGLLEIWKEHLKE